jgi:hypothetical protein
MVNKSIGIPVRIGSNVRACYLGNMSALYDEHEKKWMESCAEYKRQQMPFMADMKNVHGVQVSPSGDVDWWQQFELGEIASLTCR